MRNGWYVFATASLLAALPVAGLSDTPAKPEPYLLESNDGLLRFAMLPDGYSLAMGGGLYSYSGLYRVAEKTPLWTIDWYSFSVHLSDNGQYLVRPGGWAGFFEEPGVSFYKDSVKISEHPIKKLIHDELNVAHTVSHFFWRRKTAFYPNKGYYEIETLEGKRYLFDVTTGAIVAVEEEQLPRFAGTIRTTNGNELKVVGLRQCPDNMMSVVGIDKGPPTSFSGFRTKTDEQGKDNVVTRISVPFALLTSVSRLEDTPTGEPSFRLRGNGRQTVDVYIEVGYPLCGSDASGEAIRLSLRDIQSIDGLREVAPISAAPPAKPGVTELLQGATAGHAWHEVESALAIEAVLLPTNPEGRRVGEYTRVLHVSPPRLRPRPRLPLLRRHSPGYRFHTGLVAKRRRLHT